MRPITKAATAVIAGILVSAGAALSGAAQSAPVVKVGPPLNATDLEAFSCKADDAMVRPDSLRANIW